MVYEDYDQKHNMDDVEISFLPTDLVSNFESPPVFVTNDRQVRNLFRYLKSKTAVRLCVTFKSAGGDRRSTRVKIDLNEEPKNSSDGHENDHYVCEDVDSLHKSPKGCENSARRKDAFQRDPYNNEDGGEDDVMSGKVTDRKKKNRRVIDDFKKHQHFKSKEEMQIAFEMCAMKHNFDYKVSISCPKIWSIRCIDNICNWRVRAECFEGSTYFCINKYVAEHTCAPSRKTKLSTRASAKTVGHIIMKKYEGVKKVLNRMISELLCVQIMDIISHI
ncbi:hypothetical protein V5N11_032050 [Cardamine amara subsp. amara]|uniref:Transposase MuDR plant domain-containing protein n=1 Tax=Cardamine amara subsp. amara TaxID=228776 RepID=A0ABD1A2F2_CARAN